MSELKLFVGLGNPGKKYQYTRHNIGFLAADVLAEKLGFNFKLSSLTNAISAEGSHNGQSIMILLPQTYINNSGIAVQQVVDAKEVKLENILVICDDMNLNFGQIRIRAKGSDGGHNGLTSIIERLNSDCFARLRMGISQPRSRDQHKDYVLEPFDDAQMKILDEFKEEVVDCSLAWMEHGINTAMEKFNRRKEE